MVGASGNSQPCSGGWKAAQQNLTEDGEFAEETECDIYDKVSRKVWVRVLANIYKIDAFVYRNAARK